MKRWAAFTAIFLTLYVTGTSGQTIYDASNYYKPMTDAYDVRQRGEVFMPPCVKNLLNCWEIIRMNAFAAVSLESRQDSSETAAKTLILMNLRRVRNMSPVVTFNTPDLMCKYGREYRVALESMCMDLRFQCVEFIGTMNFTTVNVTTWNYCAPTRAAAEMIDRRPLSNGINLNNNN